MKSLFDIQRFKLFAWVGLAFLGMCTVHDISHHMGFFRAFSNILWLTTYLTAVNYVLFEYTIPRMRWRKFIRGFLWIVLYVFLFTCGLHWWAHLGYLIGVNTDYVVPHSK